MVSYNQVGKNKEERKEAQKAGQIRRNRNAKVEKGRRRHAGQKHRIE
jgi:hypothetical protein